MRNPFRRSISIRHDFIGQSWCDEELWVIDVEATGPDLRRDKIIAYGGALNETIDDGVISLEYAAAALGMPVHAPHHALGDAITTANVLLAVASRLERQLAPAQLTTAALVEKSTT